MIYKLRPITKNKQTIQATKYYEQDLQFHISQLKEFRNKRILNYKQTNDQIAITYENSQPNGQIRYETSSHHDLIGL